MKLIYYQTKLATQIIQVPDVRREVREELARPGCSVGEAGVEVLVAGVQDGLGRQQVTPFFSRQHHGVLGRIQILRPQVGAGGTQTTVEDKRLRERRQAPWK